MGKDEKFIFFSWWNISIACPSTGLSFMSYMSGLINFNESSELQSITISLIKISPVSRTKFHFLLFFLILIIWLLIVLMFFDFKAILSVSNKTFGLILPSWCEIIPCNLFPLNILLIGSVKYLKEINYKE